MNDAFTGPRSALIGSGWAWPPGRRCFPVINPHDGSVVADVVDCGAGEAQAALASAEAALPAWSALPAAQRAGLLFQWHALAQERSEELARLVTRELGKGIRDSRAEIAYGNAYIRWFAEEARRAYGTAIPSPVSGRELMVVREPVGVVAVITPWNFPYAMLARKLAPALAAGCTVVARPAEDTPLTALLLAQLALEAGIPPGVINVTPSSRERVQELTDVWMDADAVRKVSFTGSTAVGKAIAGRAASTLKRLSLELGGNAPFIVFEDADLDAAVAGAVAAKFRNSGQTCISPNRFLVHRDRYDDFLERLVQAVERLRVGDPFDDATDVGPLVNAVALAKVQRHVADAVSLGAQVRLGGRAVPAQGPACHEPTVIAGLTPDMAIFREETFGPVIAVMPFASEQEATALANATQAGLAGYFYSRDIGRVWRVARSLRVGMVGINEAAISTEVAPFGGMGESGYGREGSYLGLDDYLETKYLCMGGLAG